MSWWKWVRRAVLVGLFAVVAWTVWVVGERELVRSAGEREMAAAVAETEATDPDWHWEALAAGRKIPPSGENGAELVARVRALLPTDSFRPDDPLRWQPDDPDLEPNEPYPADAIAAARKALEPATAAVELARSFKNVTRGNRVIALGPIVLDTPLEGTQTTRTVAAVLRWDAVLAVADGDAGRAADDLLALLNVSRSVGDEPFLISQLVRIATRVIAARSLTWVLAQTELPADRLAVLQAAWAADAEEPLLLYGLRGERAAYDVLLRSLADGSVNPGAVPGLSHDDIAWWLYRGRIPRQRAYYHRYLSRAVDAARLPPHEQPAAFARLPPLPAADDFDMRLVGLLLPAAEKLAESHRRSVAGARCLVTALAVERYRLKHESWPENLSQIPKELLESVPLDPYDGSPLRYLRQSDGVVVYSIGKNGLDETGELNRTGAPGGADEGVRLWDPASRGEKSRDREVAPRDRSNDQ